VNRTRHGAVALLLVMLAAVPARGQVALVVGSVRDERGTAIAGATVAGRTAAGIWVTATTDVAGTFAMRGAGITAVGVACRFCRPASIPVVDGEPVIAIVRRYDALLADTPSNADLENLPYAHVESSLALRPFTLLAQSTAPYPGSTISDRGLSSNGSLLVDAGVPNYDVVSGESPYTLVPAFYEQSAALRGAQNAYQYGDQAAGGIAQLDPFASGSSAEAGVIGSDAIVRAQVGSDSSAISVGSYSNDEESRQRTDAFASVPLGAGQTFDISGGTEQGREYQTPWSQFAGSFSFAQASYADPQALNLNVTALTDRGTYALTNGYYPISDGWSDSGITVGVRSNGAIFGFADASYRSSTGYYDAQTSPYGAPRIGASLDQTRFDAGIALNERDLAATAGVGAFWFDYAGGAYGTSAPAQTALAVPSVQAQLFPSGKWSLDLNGSGSFSLPTLMEQYLFSDGEAIPVAIVRNSLESGALTYTDDARLRLAFEDATEYSGGAWPGRISSVGFSGTWQISPAISLRAWTMHVSDTVPIYGTVLPYDGLAPTVGELWLTYDNGSAIRADAIYRRDLLNGLPFYHVDGAVSGPIADRVRWYAGAEDRMHRTFVDFGVRFAGR